MRWWRLPYMGDMDDRLRRRPEKLEPIFLGLLDLGRACKAMHRELLDLRFHLFLELLENIDAEFQILHQSHFSHLQRLLALHAQLCPQGEHQQQQ